MLHRLSMAYGSSDNTNPKIVVFLKLSHTHTILYGEMPVDKYSFPLK